ncbi:hypothetical protein FDUTEX481_02218 [Tolypothrix sp. PCC 7601]|nr:hypothetical protein FDUTEX481_02218 [Tolypothrix sp. PCC 7601]
MNINKIMRSLFCLRSTFVTLSLNRQRLFIWGYSVFFCHKPFLV